ncbi:DUF6519 domain-containing protein [Sedimentitalea nanhaiensis]|uniref:Uncharacterized protein n=1 Tax=Sedimentitalea nanhaiensis TaxID=999627 RepID=A0A1I7BHH6_9RHOB|nr:DUF6519 domain-containing protein [Sedimentitalea nanhaiensis]SFT86630.1 hypothetical protein SAMN05216236_11060 [Sedimentitalea nanhaiensis]
MKGSNSRFSHRPQQRYSNTAHVQGGMVTDADLTEAGQIHMARDEAQNTVTVASGTPVDGGAVAITPEGPALAPGWVIAEGKQGDLRAASDTTPAGALGLFADQADLPLGPALPEKPALLYADIWERPVFAMQDPYLADPGLHGAETTYRTRTMTQIKSARFEDEDGLKSLLEQLTQGKGAFARTGSALASVKPKNTEIAVDECDPCADQIDIVPTVPNALFRVEAIRVTRDAAGRPASVQFAWSHENAAAIEHTAALTDETARDAFARAKSVYEFFSDATEAQIGRFDTDHKAERPVLSATLDPVADPEPGGNGGDPFSHVRRWDGAATVDLSGGPIKKAMGTGKMTLSGQTAVLTLDSFSMELALKDAEILPGDYWLVELRRFAAESDRIRLVGGTDNKNAPPQGIRHHFCALFTIESGKPQALNDADTRRLSFPPLTDIPATHISFDPECPDFFDNAENVAEALNSLCDLDASQVAYHPSEGCERFDGVKTVHEALEKMCKVQDDTAITRVLRLMMDWGVICGIRVTLPKRFSTMIGWTGGTILNRAGQLIDVKAGKFDLSQLPPENIHGKLNEIMEKEGEICLSLAAGKDDALELHLSDRKTAFGPTDRTYREAVDACIAGRKKVDFGKVYRPLKPAEGKIVESVLNVWANRKSLEGAVPLSEQDAKVAKAVNKTLVQEYAAQATPERADEIQKLIALAEAEMNPDDLRGAARDRRRMQLEATKIGILANAEEEDRSECECLHLLPPCPPDAGKAPYLVPVGCLKMDPGGNNRPGAIAELCALCCRKQALTWRAHRYFFGSQIDNLFAKNQDRCCSVPDKPNVDIGPWLDKWDDLLFKPIPRPKPVPEPDPLWPPKYRPDVLYDPSGPLVYQPDLSGKVVNVKPDVTRLPPATANEILTGNGFDVSKDVIDLDDVGNPLVKIAELGGASGEVLGKRAPEPGDKVVMMTSGGKVVDFVVIQKGSGKLPYETDAQTELRVEKVISKIDLPGRDGKAGIDTDGGAGVERPTLPTAELDAFAKRLDELVVMKSETETEVIRLTEDRNKLAAELGTLQAGLRKSMEDLDQIESRRAESERTIADARTELESMRKAQGELVVSLRNEQPVDVLLADNPDAAKLLRSKGILTVADIQKNPTTGLTAILRRAGMSGTEIKGLATEFIKR